MNFLEKLDFLMKENGLNRHSLSEQSGVPYTTIASWYKKGYKNLNITTLKKLSNYFGTTLDYWFSTADSSTNETHNFKISYEEEIFIKKMRKLDDYSRDTVKIILERELAKSSSTDNNRFINDDDLAVLNLGKSILEDRKHLKNDVSEAG